jgi:hypothetical protein
MPYQKIKNANSVIFNVQPLDDVNPNRKNSFMHGCLLTIFAFFILIIFLQNVSFFISIPIGIALVVFPLRYIRNAKPVTSKIRIPTTFEVFPDNLQIDGKKYLKEDIQWIKVKNTVYELPNFSMPNVTLQEGQQLIRDSWAAVNYKVDIESNGTPITIAMGIDKTTAEAIYADVTNMMGFG